MDWIWFMSTGHDTWIITEGVAKVDSTNGKLLADLFFSENDETPYLSIEGFMDNNNAIEASCKHCNSDALSFEVAGLYNESYFSVNGKTIKTISLIDGGTFIGIKCSDG